MTVTAWDKVDLIGRTAPVYVDPGDSLQQVSKLMWTESVGAVLVGQPGRLLGIVSARDVVAELAQGSDLEHVTAGRLMTRGVVSVRTDDLVHEAVYRLIDEGICHLPVRDPDGEVVGLLSVHELLRPLLIEALETEERNSELAEHPGALFG